MAVYLVTGGAGFIGSHLTDLLLAEGHQVRVLDDLSTGRRHNLDPRCALIEADIRDRQALLSAMQDAAGVFHLAAIASVERANQDWAGTHGVNQGGTIAVLDAARAMGGLPVVYASSAAVYGDIGDRIAVESLPCHPLTAYGVDKYGSELHARIGFTLHGVPSVGLRFFNVYGPRQDPSSPYSGVISIFARLIAESRPVTVHGDGGQTRDFVYVSDVVRHLWAAMRMVAARPQAAVFNVCTGVSITVADLARVMRDACPGSASVISHGPARPGDIRNSRGTAEAASAALGIHAEVAFADGIAETLRFMAQPSPAAPSGG